jgi:WD40 repeat protein
MPTCHRALVLILLVSLLVIGCGSTELAATSLPATATRIALEPTHTPLPPTPTPAPPTPTETATPTPTETATPLPTETPAPTATPTATATEVPAPTFYLEPGTRADARTYGGQLIDWGFDILLLDDGGTLIVGRADNPRPSHRIWTGKARVIRTDAEGDVLWQKDYGGQVDSMFYCPIQTGEDEYVILGQIAASYARDEEDIYLVKIDGQGNEIWSHTYGGRGMDAGNMVRQTADGGFIIVGDRADEFVTEGGYQSDLVLIKTDAEGNEVWTRTYGDKILYMGYGVVQTPDGGYILTGWEAKTIPDRDVIAIKTDENGEVEWSRTWDLDPGDRDGGFDLILKDDGHVVIAGIASMDDGLRRAVLIKVDLEGNEVWIKEYEAGDKSSEFWDIMEDTDGGYVMAGGRYLTAINRATGEAVRAGLVIKTDPDGEVLWQHTISSSEYESMLLSSAVVLPGRGYIFVGAARPIDKKHWDMLWLKVTTGGQVIAFTSERDGNSEIYVMNADGSALQRLTDDLAYDAWPTWSPDGSQIAFMSDRSGNPDIYVMDADGSNLRQLTDHPANDIWPEWSPDGARIAFPSRRDGNFEIYVINADGTNLQRLTNTPGHEDFPAWSPDGTQLVFTRSEGDDGTFVMDADGSNERRLLGFIALEPAWSPDGTRIAFGSDRGGFRAIFVMDADGSNLQKLSLTRAGENCPTWSPDGTRIAFASWRDGDGEIYVMDADGTHVRQLTYNRAEEEFPAWQPVPSPGNGSNEPEPLVVTHGGPRNERAFDVLMTEDGGSLIAGLANNTRLSHRITPGNAWLVRTDAQGAILWEKEYGGEDDAYFSSIIQAGEDEYVLLGQIAASYARDETDLHLLKVDGQGNEIWSRTFGGRGMDLGQMVRQTADGGYILVGDQADGHMTGSVYESNIYLIKTDAEGNEVWSRTYGDEILYLGWGVAQTPDGGYVLTGWEAKTIDDRDVIVIKTDKLGEVEWSRTWDLVPGERDGGFDLILTADGHVVIACIQAMGSGGPGAVLLKVDLDGNEIWKKLIGEEGIGNTFWHIMEDVDGGYVMAGDTHLGKVSGTGEDIHGGLMIKTDADGEILWQHVFSEEAYEQVSFNSAAVLPEGGYVFVGRAIPSGERYWDMLWLKVTPEAATSPTGANAPVLNAISVNTADQVERLSTLGGHSDKVIDLAFSGDGAYLASSSLDRTIKVWDVANWQEVHAFPMSKVGFNGIAPSPDGCLLASADAIWDLESKDMIHELESGRRDPAPVAFSPDGSLLAVAVEGQVIKLWDVATGEVARTFAETLDEIIFGVAFSPDGALLATGAHGGIVRLWDVKSGEVAGTLQVGQDYHDVHDVAFSPDGKSLASGGNDERVRLWDVASGQVVHALRQGNGLYGVAISPDGTLVASAGCDRTVKLWDAVSGKLLHSLRHGDEVMTVVFSPDGTLLASGGYDNLVYLWGVPHQEE